MGIKLKVGDYTYYVCRPAAADANSIRVPVLPPKSHTDWDMTLSRYFLEDQYNDVTAGIRWASPQCISYGYSIDNGCGSATSDKNALAPFYSQNLKIQEHPLLGMRPDRISSYSDELSDFVFYSDYIKATIHININQCTILDFTKNKLIKSGYHFICGKGEHTICTKIFPDHIISATNSSCRFDYVIRNIDSSDKKDRSLIINSIPVPKHILSICDLSQNWGLAAYTAWDDTDFSNWKELHWKATSKILAITKDKVQVKQDWSPKYVIKGIAIGRYTKDTDSEPNFYSLSSPLITKTDSDIVTYVSSIMDNNGFITFYRDVGDVRIGLAKSTLPVAIGELKGYSGTAAPTYSSGYNIDGKILPYDTLPLTYEETSPSNYATPWCATVVANFGSNSSKELIGYHIPSLAINPLFFEYDGYKIRCRNVLGVNVNYEITTRFAHNDWNTYSTTVTKGDDEWIDLTTYDCNNPLLGGIKIKASVNNFSTTCTLLCPISSQSLKTFLPAQSAVATKSPNVTVFTDCDRKKATVLVQNMSSACTEIRSEKNNFESTVVVPGCSQEFPLPYKSFADTIQTYWNRQQETSCDCEIAPNPNILKNTTDPSTINESKTIQVYWTNIHFNDSSIANTKENRHFAVINNETFPISLYLNGEDAVSIPAHSEYRKDVTSQQGVKILTTKDNINYCWEIKTHSSAPLTATFTNATSSKPYRFAKLGRFRTVVDSINPFFRPDNDGFLSVVILYNQIDPKPVASIKVNGVEKVSPNPNNWIDPDFEFSSVPTPYDSFRFCPLGDIPTNFSIEFEKTNTVFGYQIAIVSLIPSYCNIESDAVSEFYDINPN